MAPEAPGNLVVIELRFQNAELMGYVEHVEYKLEQTSQIEGTGGWFYVLWNETPTGEGYTPVGGGVVYVKYPLGYQITPKSRIELDILGNARFAYRHPALGEGCMFVLILPEGYTIAQPQPMPRSAKVFKKKRLAVYWKPAQKYGADIKITWQLQKLEGDLRTERNRINAEIDRAENVPDNIGVIVEKSKASYEGRLKTLYRNLNQLEEQKALHSPIDVPVRLINEIRLVKEEIAKVEEEMRQGN